MTKTKITRFIETYGMTPHEEGGFFTEIWKEKENRASHIFYLLPPHEQAAWHRVESDELWLFHEGGKLRILLGGNGDTPAEEKETILDRDHLHCLIPGGTWQCAVVDEEGAMVSCVVSPGFRYDQWELL